MKRTGNVFQAEGNRSLVGTREHTPFATKQKESREVAFVIFNSLRQNAPFINRCSVAACNPGGVAHSTLDYVFHASGGIVKRHSLNSRILAEEVAALVECNRVRKRAPNF